MRSPVPPWDLRTKERDLAAVSLFLFAQCFCGSPADTRRDPGWELTAITPQGSRRGGGSAALLMWSVLDSRRAGPRGQRQEGVSATSTSGRRLAGRRSTTEGRKLSRRGDQRRRPWCARRGRDRDRRDGLSRGRRRVMFNSLVPVSSTRVSTTSSPARMDGVHRVPDAGVAAALFVGVHAMAGTRDGLMSHTVSGRGVGAEPWFDDVSSARRGCRRSALRAWGCPVVLVTVSEAACREGTELLGDGLTTVAVKKAKSRALSARRRTARARKLIEDGARRAVESRAAVAPVRPGQPVREPRRVQEHLRARALRDRAECRAPPRPDDRLPRRHLAGRVAPVAPSRSRRACHWA